VNRALSAWYQTADKSLLTNLAFLSAIALSALLLIGAIGVSVWNSNFAAAVGVNGSSISVGEAQARGEVELFRLGQEATRVRARVSAGTLTNEQGTALLQQITDAGTNISSQLTSDLIDVLLVGQLAAEREITLDQAAIDAEWAKEITIPELRLLRRITIDIANDAETGAPERALRAALSVNVTAELLAGPVQQRDVSFVSITAPQDGGMAEEVLVRHILYSPNDDSRKADRLDPADPAWAVAEAEAKAAYDKIVAGTPMADLASESDDPGSGSEGGLLPWAVKGAYVPEFDAAVWADGLQQGDLLGPIKTQFGYHVIQFEARRAGLMLRLEQLAAELATVGEEFDARAEAAVSEFDGLMVERPGFVVQYAINPALSAIVWKLGDGGVSAVETLSDQLVIIRVNAIETKPYTDEQRSTVAVSGFSIWLDGYRSTAEVAIDGAIVQEAVGSPAP